MICGIHYTTIFNVLRRDAQAKITAAFPKRDAGRNGRDVRYPERR